MLSRTVNRSHDQRPPYRKALSPEAAQAELLWCRGSQFDPALVDSFLAMIKQ